MIVFDINDDEGSYKRADNFRMIKVIIVITKRQRLAQWRREGEGAVVESKDWSLSWTDEILGT